MKILCVLFLFKVNSTFSCYHRQPHHVLQLRGGGAFDDDIDTQESTLGHKERDGRNQRINKSPKVIEINPSFLDEKKTQDEAVKTAAGRDNSSTRTTANSERKQIRELRTGSAVDRDQSNSENHHRIHHQKPEESTRSPEGVAFVPKAEKSEMEPIDRKINNGLRDRFADASISLQRLLESQKPIALNFAKEVKGRYGETASKINAMKFITLQHLQALDKSSVHASIMTRAFDAKHRIRNVSGLAIHSALEFRISEEMLVILCTFACSLVGTSLGFLSFLYFVSVGYGASIAMIACSLLVVGNVSKSAICM
jgi:hypothetical protein